MVIDNHRKYMLTKEIMMMAMGRWKVGEFEEEVLIIRMGHKATA